MEIKIGEKVMSTKKETTAPSTDDNTEGNGA